MPTATLNAFEAPPLPKPLGWARVFTPWMTTRKMTHGVVTRVAVFSREQVEERDRQWLEMLQAHMSHDTGSQGLVNDAFRKAAEQALLLLDKDRIGPAEAAATLRAALAPPAQTKAPA